MVKETCNQDLSLSIHAKKYPFNAVLNGLELAWRKPEYPTNFLDCLPTCLSVLFLAIGCNLDATEESYNKDPTLSIHLLLYFIGHSTENLKNWGIVRIARSPYFMDCKLGFFNLIFMVRSYRW